MQGAVRLCDAVAGLEVSSAASCFGIAATGRNGYSAETERFFVPAIHIYKNSIFIAGIKTQ
jgi:hypothetical protein